MHPPGFFFRPILVGFLPCLLLAMALAAAPVAAFRLPATGLVQCYDDTGVIDCPAQGEAYSGQDGNYRKGAALNYVADDEVVSDTATGFVWQKIPRTEAATWQEAVDYCNGLVLAGTSGWRLPSMQELMSLILWGQSASPHISPAFSDGNGQYWSDTVWSADSRADDATAVAWYLNYSMAMAYTTGKTSSRHVRCVRGAGLRP
jgi:hypothetical protein